MIITTDCIHKGNRVVKLKFPFDDKIKQQVRKLKGCKYSATMSAWYIPYISDFNNYLRRELVGIEIKSSIETQIEHSKIALNKTTEKAHISVVHIKEKGLLHIKFPYKYVNSIKRLEGIYYHPNSQSWSAHATKENWSLLKEIFPKENFDIHLKSYDSYSGARREKAEAKVEVKVKVKVKKNTVKLEDIVDKRFEEQMFLKKMSENTVQIYKHQINKFLHAFKGKDYSLIDSKEINAYIYQDIKKYNFGRSHQNQLVSALKAYYKIMYNRLLVSSELPRPKKSRPLPKVLSKEEIQMLFKRCNNLKHKTILLLLYGCGMRRGEIISLKVENIDFSNKVIYIIGKGDKTRIAPISGQSEKLIKDYIEVYKPSSELFAGLFQDKYSGTSIGKIVSRLAKACDIKKNVTPHMLRHSFATHLMEDGVDIRIIQELLGHSSSKTTEIYTYVSRKNIRNIKSPVEGMEL